MTKFRYGAPQQIDHTPGSAVAAGDVLLIGDVPCVAHGDIAASKLGAVAIKGGIYEMTADGEIAAGKKVYWDATAKKVTLTDTNNKVFGYTVTAAAQDGDAVDVLQDPSA